MKDNLVGFFAPWAAYALMLGLHVFLPARKVDGYVTDPATGRPYRYRLTGLLVFAILVVLWVVLGRTGVMGWDWLYQHRWSGLAGAFALGLLVSGWLVASGSPTGRSWLADFYFGRTMNRQVLGGRVDVKMFLYLVGAAMLGLNLLSFTAHHLLTYSAQFSRGIVLYCALFLWFIVDYLFFERVHLYTYDLFAERLGFKLGFGCLTFYPYFYLIGLWGTAHLPDPGVPVWLMVLAGVLFFAGWGFARGANMQKYKFKQDPSRPFLGFLRPKVLSDGERALLCSGFWGVARHVNYLGEILMAVGLTLALGRPEVWIAWLYPAYYIFLLVPRERADERRCAAKYGALWAEYVRRVPHRIVPWLY